MSEQDNFQFFGFPTNEEIEIPDPVTPPERNKSMQFGDPQKFLKDLSNMDAEQLKKRLPPEAISELEEIAESNNTDIETLLNNSVKTSKILTGNPLELIHMLDDLFDEVLSDIVESDEENDDECECEHTRYELADIKYLRPEYFGSVECVEDPDLYEHFVEVYGTDSTKYLDNNVGLKDFAYTPVTAMLPLQNIKDMKFMEANERFILFYAEPDLENTYGFFVAVIKTEKDFALYIPEFRNTFNIDDEGNVTLYNPEENPALFSIDAATKTASFDLISIPSIEFAINFALAPLKRTLLTPHQFGTIKNTMPAVTKDAMFLKVGTITSNETPEAILLKKDAELDLEEITFPLYFNFGQVISADSLREVANVLFKTDLNNCALLDNCELKYTSDHKLYIDVDLGEF